MSNMSSITRQTTRSQGYTPVKSFKTILADRSGSMCSFSGKQYDMAEHLLKDAKKQAVETNQSAYVTFVTFDDKVNTLLDNADLLCVDVPLRPDIEDALLPRHTTRFNDTLIEQVDALTQKKDAYLNSLTRAARRLNPDVAMVLIAITDGQDNESKHSVAETREKMIQFRKNGGRAILMAANMNAEEVGGWYGFNPEKSITVHNSDEAAIEHCYRAVSGMARNLTQGIDAPAFSSLQRAQSSQITPADDSDEDNGPLDWADNNNVPHHPCWNQTLMPPPLTRVQRY